MYQYPLLPPIQTRRFRTIVGNVQNTIHSRDFGEQRNALTQLHSALPRVFDTDVIQSFLPRMYSNVMTILTMSSIQQKRELFPIVTSIIYMLFSTKACTDYFPRQWYYEDTLGGLNPIPTLLEISTEIEMEHKMLDILHYLLNNTVFAQSLYNNEEIMGQIYGFLAQTFDAHTQNVLNVLSTIIEQYPASVPIFLFEKIVSAFESGISDVHAYATLSNILATLLLRSEIAELFVYMNKGPVVVNQIERVLFEIQHSTSISDFDMHANRHILLKLLKIANSIRDSIDIPCALIIQAIEYCEKEDTRIVYILLQYLLQKGNEDDNALIYAFVDSIHPLVGLKHGEHLHLILEIFLLKRDLSANVRRFLLESYISPPEDTSSENMAYLLILLKIWTDGHSDILLDIHEMTDDEILIKQVRAVCSSSTEPWFYHSYMLGSFLLKIMKLYKEYLWIQLYGYISLIRTCAIENMDDVEHISLIKHILRHISIRNLQYDAEERVHLMQDVMYIFSECINENVLKRNARWFQDQCLSFATDVMIHYLSNPFIQKNGLQIIALCSSSINTRNISRIFHLLNSAYRHNFIKSEWTQLNMIKILYAIIELEYGRDLIYSGLLPHMFSHIRSAQGEAIEWWTSVLKMIQEKDPGGNLFTQDVMGEDIYTMIYNP
jgi:hypothetical protein